MDQTKLHSYLYADGKNLKSALVMTADSSHVQVLNLPMVGLNQILQLVSSASVFMFKLGVLLLQRLCK